MIHHDGSSIANRAYEHIRTRVLGGRYPAGKRLVTRQIAQELGASLNPVREALGRLAAEGLIDHIPGAGSFVRTPDPEEILELYEFREAIEPFAARKAARSITEPELGVLRDICAEQHQLSRSIRTGGHLEGDALDRWFGTEERFHAALIRAAGNRHFDRAITQSRVLTQLFQGHRTIGVHVDLRMAAHTWRSHRRLVRALESRDAEAAATCMLESLREGARTALATARNTRAQPPPT